jgi:Na+/proline symporter
MLSPWLILGFVALYFAALLLIGWITTRTSDNDSYFLGNNQSPWYAVAFGMIGDSLSGVTYISVPGAVGSAKFSYLQLVMGYVAGYFIIGKILLPLYYKMELTSIYTYLEERIGLKAQKTGAFFFLISRLLGAAARLWLAVSVLQLFVFNALNIPFELSVLVIIVLMLVYTYRGGIKTLVWTDTFQSSFLLMGVILSIVAIASQLDFGFFDLISAVKNSPDTQVFFWDPLPKNYFFKQFFAGVFIAVAMTGLDQNMMQKNLSCPNLADGQKNVYWFGIVQFCVNALFLSLGALLYVYATAKGIALPVNPETGKVITDKVFPFLALGHLGTFAAMIFVVGLTAATFNSADSVLTTLTTSFYIDIMKVDKAGRSEADKTRLRHIIHISFAVLLLLVILVFQALNDSAVIDTVLLIAGYTYGPLLGLFAFGIFTRRTASDMWVPLVCILAPVLCYWLNMQVPKWFNGYQIGNELLIINGAITFAGLILISKRNAFKAAN